MFEIGKICIKIAGRDAGKIAIVVDKLDKNHVLIDGNVRRRKCSLLHLEPSEKTLKIKKGASTSEVHKAMQSSKLKVEVFKKVKRSPKKDTSKKSEKPTKKRKVKVKEPKKSKTKKPAKKENTKVKKETKTKNGK